MQYHPNKIEPKWQKFWKENNTFQADNKSDKPKYYVLDMFPYPSGAGLHVGHPLGYIASDIYSRYKRHKGCNVLHPMGYDSFGLPAEQYAIQTGQHPAITTKENIARYREQLDKIGFSFDWSREVRTSSPDYYKWTQWIFLQLFDAYFCNDSQQARPIDELIEVFETEGNININAATSQTDTFTQNEWKNFTEKEKSDILLNYRLTYLAEAEVNWCPALGTVLANDEVVNGASERGGHPVERKKMTQWMMRITAFAERLLNGIEYNIEDIDISEALRESQKNWIGKSKGASVEFPIQTFPKGEGKTPNKQFGYMTGGDNSHLLVQMAQQNRKEATEAEDLLWKELRGKKIGYKFRRQHPIDDFIVDFVCLRQGLIIEVDGGYHDDVEQKELDERRSQILETIGYRIIRFKNEEVLSGIESVLNKIKEVLKQQESSKAEQTPLSLGKGLGDRIEVFTTRPDTIFGVSFMVLAPEHEWVAQITTEDKKEAVENYIEVTAKRSERERMADVKKISGEFTGAYAIHPFTGQEIPIWIADYVLAGYGTGAVMAVPAGDERDYAFAKHFDLPIPDIFEGVDISEEAYSDKTGKAKLQNSDFLNGLTVKEALPKAIAALEEKGIGQGQINYRLRDAVFSRQRYWGEPVPMYFKNGIPTPIPTECLPLELPEIDEYLPTETGEPPLGRADVWSWDEVNKKVVRNEDAMLKQVQHDSFDKNIKPEDDCHSELVSESHVYPLELNTMPGWAGSSWYMFRYMDANNTEEFAAKEALNYWQNVDLYLGGSEHATGHLLYVRFWTKFLHDIGYLPVDEPFKKLINQGMILGESAFVYRNIEDGKFYSQKLVEGKFSESENSGLTSGKKIQSLHSHISFVNEKDNSLDVEKFKAWRPEYADAEFITEEDGKFYVSREVEKMSKSKFNVVNPDDICEEYGADTLRMYEMFLGPIEQSKPWNTNGLSGVYGFLKRFWKLFYNGEDLLVSDDEPSKEEYKVLHTLIKKVTEDIENFSFNTSVSAFMIAVNDLQKLKCNKRAILAPMTVLLSPFAPHIAEELWHQLGHEESISQVAFPLLEEKYLVEDTKKYPISFNGKMRFTMELPLDMSKDKIEKTVMADERTQKYLEGGVPKKVIVVPGKIINLVR